MFDWVEWGTEIKFCMMCWCGVPDSLASLADC